MYSEAKELHVVFPRRKPHRAILLVHSNWKTALRKDIAKKLSGCFALAAGILTHKIVGPGAAAVKSYQVESRDRLGVAVTVDAEDARALAPDIEGDEIVCGPTLTTIERNGSTLLWAFIEMPQGRLQRKTALGIDPARRDLVSGLVEITIKRDWRRIRCPRKGRYLPVRDTP